MHSSIAINLFWKNSQIFWGRVIDEDDISEEEISEIAKWIDSKYEEASRKMEITNLPDSIEYGDDIEIWGINE